MSKAPRTSPPHFDGDLQPAAAGRGLARRLTALARLLQIGRARQGPDGFGTALLDDTQRVLTQADQRLRLSGNHTVVALAGGNWPNLHTLNLSKNKFKAPGLAAIIHKLGAGACVQSINTLVLDNAVDVNKDLHGMASIHPSIHPSVQ